MQHSVTYRSAFFPLLHVGAIKNGLINICTHSQTACLLASNGYKQDPYHKYELLAGWGSMHDFSANQDSSDPFGQLSAWLKQGLLSLGHFTYDLKNNIELLRSDNDELIAFPDIHFFIPENIVSITPVGIQIQSVYEEPKELFEKIIHKGETSDSAGPVIVSSIKSIPDKESYLSSVEKIKDHIREGDIYEMNYCRHYEGKVEQFHVEEVFKTLLTGSSTPFSCLYVYKGSYALCVSPERFLCKRKNELITQPIKGTIRRGADNEEDSLMRESLATSIKDKAEHIMIVDLCRNDLSRNCIPGSVSVPELYGIYPFRSVTHMISTVTGTLPDKADSIQALKSCFPMGSMTGAPKIRAMELIETFEQFKRGMFSGSIGYIDTDGEFDFNVVIRTLFYDSIRQKIVVPVGGAIVFDSDPEEEFNEGTLKVKGLLSALGIDVNTLF